MTTYESDIKTISSNEEVVFGILGDLNHLKRLEETPQLSEKVKDLRYDTDSCSFIVDGLGQIGFRIVEREPFKTIKFESDNSPMHVTGWIQLKQVAENDTKMKLTMKVDLPAMVKMMLDKKIKEGLNKIADVLAASLSAQ